MGSTWVELLCLQKSSNTRQLWFCIERFDFQLSVPPFSDFTACIQATFEGHLEGESLTGTICAISLLPLSYQVDCFGTGLLLSSSIPTINGDLQWICINQTDPSAGPRLELLDFLRFACSSRNLVMHGECKSFLLHSAGSSIPDLADCSAGRSSPGRKEYSI